MIRAVTGVSYLLPLVLLCFFFAKSQAAMIVEKVERVDAAASTHIKLPPITGPLPAQGVPFLEPTTGYKITRISDVVSAGGFPNFPKGWDGQKGSGLTNGYALYSCANRDGTYVLAFGTTPMSVLYRLADAKSLGVLRSKSGASIGDKAEPRWSRLASDSATTIYYHVGSLLLKQDVLLGPSSEQTVKDFGVGFATPKDNTELSDDGRYGAFHLLDNRTVVFDFANKVILPGRVLANVSGVNVSPDGKWVKFMEPYKLGAYCRMADFIDGSNNDATSHPLYRPTPGGHGAWGWDGDGNCVEIYQNNENDWFEAFDPASKVIIKIIYMGELGWSVSQHIARMPAAAKGWALVSTYVGADAAWAYNQLFMLEIKPLMSADGSTVPIAQRPRIWRLGHTQGNYSGGFFSEAFASIDMAGQNIYWGTNWRGNDNLELYRMELPDGWHDALSSGGAAPTPIPTVLPTPESYILSGTKGQTLHSQNSSGLIHLPGPASSWVTDDPTPTPSPTPTAPVTIYASASNFCYCSKENIGDTTQDAYLPLVSMAPEANSSTADTQAIFAFQLPNRPIKKATLVLFHHPKTEFGGHVSGHEDIPVRLISGAPFTPAWIHYPDKVGEYRYDGASYRYRIQTTATLEKWSALPSNARVVFARTVGDLSTVMSPVTPETPRLNFSTSLDYSTVEITGLAQSRIGTLLQIALDPMSSETADRFGSPSNLNGLMFRIRQALYGVGAADPAKRPRLKIIYE